MIIDAEDLLNIDPNSSKASYMLALLHSCTLSDDRVKDITNELLDGKMKADKFDKLIIKLQDSQADKIDAGHNYGQREIHQKLDRMEGKL